MYRRLWPIVRGRLAICVNRTEIRHLLMPKRRYSYEQPPPGIEATHLDCDQEGWDQLAGVIHCPDRWLMRVRPSWFPHRRSRWR
jgi:hypothetical protein